MKLSDAIKVRLREGQALVYAAEAEQRGVGLATYIRTRLEEADIKREELESIRAALLEIGDVVDALREERSGPTPSTTAPPNAVQIETLMLLRAIVSPDRLRMVQAELDRQGMQPWRGDVR